MASNPAGGGDRQYREAAEFSKPREIRPFHRSFAVHVSGKKSGTIRLKLRNHVVGAQCEALPPTLYKDASSFRVYSEDHILAANTFAQLSEEIVGDFTVAERSAAHDDFFRAPGKKLLRPCDCANSAADANLHLGAAEKHFDPPAVRAGADRRVQVNHM